MTVKELWKYCNQEMIAGNGDKIILIASDDEGNYFRKLYYSFTKVDPKEIIENLYLYDTTIEESNKIIILG